MILAFDTYYHPDHTADTVCIAFDDWKNAKIADCYKEHLGDIADYESGNFYKRELPCILSLLKKISREDIATIVVDGFVYLDNDLRYGLGGYLYEALGGAVPVIGVAKTNFATLTEHKTALVRGGSSRPLYITAIGIDLETAVGNIEKMNGNFRIPTLLKELDKMTRDGTHCQPARAK